MTYLEPAENAVIDLLQRRPEGSVIMLNLLRFRKMADYSGTPELAGPEPISGRQAYQLYAEHTMPYLIETGGHLLLSADGGRFLIGPQTERWDAVLLIQQDSIDAFLSFAQNDAYLVGLGHRTAALEDSRLLPLTDYMLTI